MNNNPIPAELETKPQATRPARMSFVVTAVVACTMLLAGLILAAHYVEPRPIDAISSADSDASTLTENQAYALYRRSI